MLLLPFTLVPWRSNLVFAPLFSNHGAPTVCFSHFFFCQVSKQCTKAVNTANRILGLISRTHYTEFKSKDTVLQLYKSLVRPHLEYCIQCWNPYYRKDSELMEKDQRRATRMIDSLKKYCYHERLHRLQLTTLENRKVRGDLIEVYKIVNGFEVGLERYQTRHTIPNNIGLSHCQYPIPIPISVCGETLN